MANNEAKKIIVGLGNPGPEYENTYHNVGQLAILMLEKEKSISLPGRNPQTLNSFLFFKRNPAIEAWEKYKNIFEYAAFDDVVFVRPLTFMNESGKAVRETLKKFNAQPQDLILIHDDSDIMIGNYKVSFARNSAGHKGVQSVIDILKTNAFTRGRIGIRPARETVRQKAGEFALKQISKKDRKILDELFQPLYEKVTEKE